MSGKGGNHFLPWIGLLIILYKVCVKSLLFFMPYSAFSKLNMLLSLLSSIKLNMLCPMPYIVEQALFYELGCPVCTPQLEPPPHRQLPARLRLRQARRRRIHQEILQRGCKVRLYYCIKENFSVQNESWKLKLSLGLIALRNAKYNI